MSTNGMTSWAVDLKDIAEIYPFPGTEVMLYVAGLVFWIGWHVLQLRGEATEVSHEMDADQSGDKARAAIERY
ncbi:MAG: hypothetical protein JKX91_03665 [Rhizobiaceae bacterium]|nr:hypothetical protein [Rhizobiaceae bacterium]